MSFSRGCRRVGRRYRSRMHDARSDPQRYQTLRFSEDRLRGRRVRDPAQRGSRDAAASTGSLWNITTRERQRKRSQSLEKHRFRVDVFEKLDETTGVLSDESQLRPVMTEAVKLCHVIDASTRNPLLFDSIKYSDRQRINYEVVTLSPTGEFHQQLGAIGVPAISINTNSRPISVSNSKTRTSVSARAVRYRASSFLRGEFGRPDSSDDRPGSGKDLLRTPLARSSTLQEPAKLLRRQFFVPASLATDVLAPSENMKTIFIESQRVPPDRIRVIPHGLISRSGSVRARPIPVSAKNTV